MRVWEWWLRHAGPNLTVEDTIALMVKLDVKMEHLNQEVVSAGFLENGFPFYEFANVRYVYNGMRSFTIRL